MKHAGIRHCELPNTCTASHHTKLIPVFNSEVQHRLHLDRIRSGRKVQSEEACVSFKEAIWVFESQVESPWQLGQTTRRGCFAAPKVQQLLLPFHRHFPNERPKQSCGRTRVGAATVRVVLECTTPSILYNLLGMCQHKLGIYLSPTRSLIGCTRKAKCKNAAQKCPR